MSVHACLKGLDGLEAGREGGGEDEDGDEEGGRKAGKREAGREKEVTHAYGA